MRNVSQPLPKVVISDEIVVGRCAASQAESPNGSRSWTLTANKQKTNSGGVSQTEERDIYVETNKSLCDLHESFFTVLLFSDVPIRNQPIDLF